MRKYTCLMVLGLLVGCDQSPNDTSTNAQPKILSASASNSRPVDISKAKVTEPSETQRQITAYLLDPHSKKDGFIEKQVDAKSLTIQQVYDALQPKDEQDITIECKGGYNPQPPYYKLAFDLFNGAKMTDRFVGKDRKTAIHQLCMSKAYEHFNLLKANNDPDLKYFISQ